MAAKLALEKGLACNTGGGTHHAFAGHGSGYCLINDMAVTAVALIHQKAVDRVLIVDLDVHQVCVRCGHKLFCCFNFVYLVHLNNCGSMRSLLNFDVYASENKNMTQS
jgi:hypothetical protein